MDIADANGILGFITGGLSWFTIWLNKVIAWVFTFRNLFVIGIIILIVIITYKLFEMDVNRKKYYYSRNREI